MNNKLHHAKKLIRENRRAYIILNVTYYGLVILGMAYSAINPQIQKTLIEWVRRRVHAGGPLLKEMALIFVINLFTGSLGTITLPSLVIPFCGLLMGVYRAAAWGLMLSPASPELAKTMIPHSLTLIVEGQAYIVAMLAVFIHGKAFIWPRSAGVESRWKGYVEGLKRTGQLYLLVIILLIVAAVYESLEVALLLPLLH